MAVQKFLSLRHFSAAFLLAAVSSSYADVTLKPVALSRDKFPARGSKLRQGSFGAPGLNDRNSVAYYATCYGSGVSANTNAFIGRLPKKGKNGRLIFQKGMKLLNNTGTSLGTLTSLSANPHINNNSYVAWSGVFTNIYYVDGSQVIEANTYFLRSTQKGNLGSYSYFPDQSITDYDFDLNSKGAICLLATNLSQPDSPLSVFRQTVSSSLPLVAVGETAVGLPLGSVFSDFGTPTIADNNALVFSAKVSDTDNKFDGIWYGKNGDPNPVVLNGENIPDVGEITSFGDLTVVSPSGNLISFLATAGSTTGIFVKNMASGEIKMIAYTGQTVTDYSIALTGIQPAAVNNSGAVAFGIKSGGAAANSDNIDRINALFFVKPGAEPQKVIANGDTVVVKGKQKRVIDIRFGPARGLNNLGYVAFTASFSDRTSGVFLAKP